MASPLINTRADLDSITGTPEHAAFIAALRGSIYTLERDEFLKKWVARADTTALERFGFALEDFPDAKPPAIPAYTEPSAVEVATGLAVAIEQANPITHRNQRDFFLAVIAALGGNPLEKNLDGTYKYPGPAKAALVSAEIDAVMKR